MPELAPLTSTIGCEISGIDLSGKLDADDVAFVRGALLEYGVIFFRNQDLSPAAQVRFAEQFGDPDEYPFIEGLPGFPTVTPVIKKPDEKINFGGLWHSDTTYLPRPPMGTILHARELPPVGGDTLFADMSLAYDTLSDKMKAFLAGLVAVNTAHKSHVSSTRSARIQDSGKDVGDIVLEARHPIVRTHPETGRKSLYVNGAHTAQIEGMTDPESRALLSFLFDHQTREEFTCRFKWSEGAVAFWDNRCTQHYPLNDYPGYSRVMNRVTLKGDVPR